jgi:chromosome segregation ATPase
MLCLLSAACASDEALQKRVRSLQEEVDRVQSRADRLEERLTAVEIGRQKQTLHVDSDGEVSVDERPNLKVVKVAPSAKTTQAKLSSAGEEAKAADQGPRPVIRATGSGEGRIDNLEPEKARPTPRETSDEDGGS